MHDFLSHAVSSRWSGEDDDIRMFAGRVVDVLARRVSQDDVKPPEAVIGPMLAACISADPTALDQTVARMIRNRVPPAVIADLYVPTVARRMGIEWEEDRLSFSLVSIGCARLQSVLRELGRSWSSHLTPSVSKASVLLMVPEGEDHTLGALAAAGQLRRSGVSVCLKLQAGAAELADLVRGRGFDAVMISAANVERIEQIAKLTGTLRSAARTELPVFLGGAIIHRQDDLAAATGADMATADLETVVRRIDAAAITNRASRRA